MGEPYTIRIYVPDGDPDGVKIIDHLNWTGVGIGFPRSAWPHLAKRLEFDRAGVYVLTGTGEGTDDDLPTIYVGQGDEIRTRIDAHHANKDFWEWGYAFVSNGDSLNRAHITWLEYALLQRASKARRCHLDNGNLPKEPALSECERVGTEGFLREMLRILPLLGVRVFETATPVAQADSDTVPAAPLHYETDERDTIVVPAREEGFQQTFLGEDAWHAIKISGGMLPRIKYIAAYRTAPVAAITHYATVDRIEPYGNEDKYRLVFTEPAKEIKRIPLGDAIPGAMRGPRYTSLAKLLSAKTVADLFGHAHPRSSE
jgi:hypothetical protein